ncbi:MAG: methionyl-tRNA formyltransferase [Candidatus Uhrbacteria bacterium]|nr:methionyl-tRNA formyltransferase [Candidatus Uhrbacteria bacterium]
MKIVFFGTPEFSVNFLKALHADEDILVSAVVCQPDKAVGRKQILTAPPTKVFALQNNIDVIQPDDLRSSVQTVQTLKSIGADAFIVVAYGKIIPDEILQIPRLRTLNVHPSLLPKYRGPSPMQSAISAGETETGVSIMILDAKMDHGPILAQAVINLEASETIETLETKVVDVGAPLLIDALKKYATGQLEAKDQDHDKATICKLLSREDGVIDWRESAEVIERKIRAYQPWPGTSTLWNDKSLKIHRACIARAHDELEEIPLNLKPGQVKIVNHKLYIGTGKEALEVLELQLESKQKMKSEAFVAGNSDINDIMLD